MAKTADEMIVTHIEKMWGGLEMASVEHFVETGKVNGSFRERLKELMLKFAQGWDKIAYSSLSSPVKGVEDYFSNLDPSVLTKPMSDKKEEWEKYFIRCIESDQVKDLAVVFDAIWKAGASWHQSLLSQEEQDALWEEVGKKIMAGYDDMVAQAAMTVELKQQYHLIKR